MSDFKLLLASKNQGKLKEIRNRLSDLSLNIISLSDFPECPEADEPYDTYVDNARQKAQLAAEHSGLWALADDSGLEVDFLDGAPGVKSARYAGAGVTYQDNCRKLLKELRGVTRDNRGAIFRCCMVLRSLGGQEYITEGKLVGRISEAPRGNQGFGYDPVFELEDRGLTLAELSLEEKNRLSHRYQALNKMKIIIRSILGGV